jgi:hypothetical protein
MTEPDKPQEPEQVIYGDQSLHLAFEQNLREMLDRAELTEEQKQQILAALHCPCCGSGGMSISVKLKD